MSIDATMWSADAIVHCASNSVTNSPEYRSQHKKYRTVLSLHIKSSIASGDYVYPNCMHACYINSLRPGRFPQAIQVEHWSEFLPFQTTDGMATIHLSYHTFQSKRLEC